MDYLHVQADNPWYNYYVVPANLTNIVSGKRKKNKLSERVGLPFIVALPKEAVSVTGKVDGINRGPYMSIHVLLNLLNRLGKRDKMRDLPSILSLFRNEFDKFNNTRARMLDSIYHMTNALKSDFWRKKRYNFVIMYAPLLWTS